MSISVAVIMFFILILMYAAFTEIFSIMFMITGVPEDKAKFQVVSLITATGFTTKESETIVYTPLRKKIASAIMIFTYSFNLSIIALFVNFFSSIKSVSNINYLAIGISAFVFIALYVLIKILPFTKKIFKNMIEKIAKKFILKGDRNHLLIIEKIDNMVMCEVILNILPVDVINSNILESNIKNKYDIQIIYIRRNSEMIYPVRAHVSFVKGDQLHLIGPENKITEFMNNIK